MTLSRLLAAALMLCSLPLFAQDHPKSHRMAGQPPLFCFKPAATSEEPWTIVSDLPGKSTSGADLMERLNSNAQFHVDSERPACRVSATDSWDRTLSTTWVSAAGNLETAVLNSQSDLTCYTIRSYVVARDSKDSDSTHPAGYSTCRPSDRYQVRTTEIRTAGER